ncbi:SDR family oxidoreductase [Lichenihabitans sp. PAMC28606]|uniref:SDR family NAD(P)-dependent oxidoreductase n=1 Tax=Lichenihabitans sp. PAMC28606 TaxID=2880932 RepID=UPI001D0ADE12|nr:SDR family oxidoreductase [Lichenihabitans sp. PAMC28606]UDL96720.1 SDR family oxidoreductase [Lichenihabitans sp. PAMC28606]
MGAELKGVAIVTGAGSGIGLAVAQRLARDGFTVVVNDLEAERAEEAAVSIRAAGGQAEAVAGDVSREADVAAIAALADGLGPCTVLVNNAGYVHQARFVDLTAHDFDRMVAVHVRGTFLCTKAVLPGMLARGAGSIINMASQLGQIGGIELVHYSAAKAAIIGLTKALAREVSANGVRVNAVAPGPINTPLVQALSEDWRRAKAAELPLGHFGEPEDVAGTVSFLASDDAKIYVGQTLGPNSGDVML